MVLSIAVDCSIDLSLVVSHNQIRQDVVSLSNGEIMNTKFSTAILLLMTALASVCNSSLIAQTQGSGKKSTTTNRELRDPQSQDIAKWQEKLDQVASLAGVGKFSDATIAARETVNIAESIFDKSDDRLAKSLLVLSSLLFQQAKLDESAELARRAHHIRTQALDTAQANVATTLKFLGNVLMQQGKMDEAVTIFEQAVQLSVSSVGAEHPETAKHMGNLGAVYLGKGNTLKAKEQFDLAMEIWNKQARPNPVYTVATMTNLAKMHFADGDHEKAFSLYQEGLVIQEAAFGKDNPRLSNTLRNYAKLLRQAGKTEEAVKVESRLEKLSGK